MEEWDPQPHTLYSINLAEQTGYGPSIAETMMRTGCRWTPSDSNRIAGKMKSQ